MAGREVDDGRRNEERRDPRGPSLQQRGVLALDDLEPANAAADDHAGACGAGSVERQGRRLDRHAGRSDGKVDEPRGVPDLLALEIVLRGEALHLGGDAAAVSRGVEQGDPFDARRPGAKRGPGRVDADAHRADDAKPGDGNSMTIDPASHADGGLRRNDDRTAPARGRAFRCRPRGIDGPGGAGDEPARNRQRPNALAVGQQPRQEQRAHERGNEQRRRVATASRCPTGHEQRQLIEAGLDVPGHRTADRGSAARQLGSERGDGTAARTGLAMRRRQIGLGHPTNHGAGRTGLHPIEAGPRLGERASAGLDDQRVLVPKVGIESAVRQPELPHHRRDTEPREAALPESATGGGDDPLSGLVFVVGGVAHRNGSGRARAGVYMIDIISSDCRSFELAFSARAERRRCRRNPLGRHLRLCVVVRDEAIDLGGLVPAEVLRPAKGDRLVEQLDVDRERRPASSDRRRRTARDRLRR